MVNVFTFTNSILSFKRTKNIMWQKYLRTILYQNRTFK